MIYICPRGYIKNMLYEELQEKKLVVYGMIVTEETEDFFRYYRELIKDLYE